jgi:antitoxin component YwqK of YwqJK toxin-antitoxin module
VKTAEANYNKGKKDGPWYIWDENGTKRYEMYYKKGNKVGHWKMWNENGELTMERNY